MALLDNNAAVYERVWYTPYGERGTTGARTTTAMVAPFDWYWTL